MSRSKPSVVPSIAPIIPAMEEEYLEIFSELAYACATSQQKHFASLLQNFLPPETKESDEESEYFIARFSEDLHKLRSAFDQETTHKVIQNCGAAPGKLLNREVAKANLRILESMDSFNKKFDVPFFDLGSQLDEEDFENMIEAQHLLSGDEEWNMKYGEMLHTLESEYFTYHKVANTRLYSDPQKNILAILKDFTHVKAFKGEGTEANIWEAYKILFGTGKRADEITNFYLKPILEVLLVSARDDGFEVFTKSHGKEMVGEHGPGIRLGYLDLSKRKLDVTGQGPKFLAETIAHEAAHLADYVISPHVISEEFADQLVPIIKNLQAMQSTIHPTFSAIFLYSEKEWSPELLARGIELIAAEKEEGLKILQEQAPDLLLFYKDIFLPECRRYVTEKLTAKPLLLQSFEENFSETSSVESDDEDKKGRVGRSSRAASGKENLRGDGYDADSEAPPPLPKPTTIRPIEITETAPTTTVTPDTTPLPAPSKAREIKKDDKEKIHD